MLSVAGEVYFDKYQLSVFSLLKYLPVFFAHSFFFKVIYKSLRHFEVINYLALQQVFDSFDFLILCLKIKFFILSFCLL